MVKVSPIWFYKEVEFFVVIKEEICYTICKILGLVFSPTHSTDPNYLGLFPIPHKNFYLYAIIELVKEPKVIIVLKSKKSKSNAERI